MTKSHVGLFKYLQILTEASDIAQEPIVTQWGDQGIVINPGTSAFAIYGAIRAKEKN